MNRERGSGAARSQGMASGAMVLLALLSPLQLVAQQAWQELSLPSMAAAGAGFASPPPEYSATVTWGWDEMNREAIGVDLDDLHARGFRAVTIEAGYGMPADYLTEGWFDLVGEAVRQAKARDMRVWIIDEGKYPSGFAGGKFSRERPDLRMQAVIIGERVPVAGGTTVSRDLPRETFSAAAVNTVDGTGHPIAIDGRHLRWTAPADGEWQLWLARHEFRTSATRAVNNPTRGKDGTNSLFDYLDPTATRQFIEFTHEQYRRRLGTEFGSTILGFRGDEPDYGNTPWTPGILEKFTERKGYDVQPYLASFFAREPSEEARRAKADYWDVWSEIFGESFFGVQAEWADRYGVEHLTHLNHEDRGIQMARSEGDYFRAMRSVQIPGIDVIWNQVWPDSAPADFPKLASSAAHLFGRPRALSESFAAFNPRPTVEEAKWVIDHQLVRGINLFEFMFYPSSARGRPGASGYMADPAFPALNQYTHRLSYLLAQGRPTAEIAVFYPTSSLWLGDEGADVSNLAIVRELIEHQRDFDWVDEYSLASGLALEGGTFRNGSGQQYRAVIVPRVAALSKAALDRLERFAAGGGSVTFLGAPPEMIVERTFLDATGPGRIDWALLEPTGRLTERVLQALPAPDFAVDQSTPGLVYLHRRLEDAEVYLLFNEGKEAIATTATLQGGGRPQQWDPYTGAMSGVVDASVRDGSVRVPLRMDPGETRLLVVPTAG